MSAQPLKQDLSFREKSPLFLPPAPELWLRDFVQGERQNKTKRKAAEAFPNELLLLQQIVGKFNLKTFSKQ